MGIWETDVDNVLDRIKKWKPGTLATEAEYEEALYAFLHEEFPKEVFIRQYIHSKTRADIYVHFNDAAQVAVEVKAHLTDRNEYHRMLGQLWTYTHEWKCEVVLVVCGTNDPALVKLAERYISFLDGNQDKKVRFIEVKA